MVLGPTPFFQPFWVMSMFKIGDEVVCVIGGRLSDSSPRLNQFPVKGETYHIRGFEQSIYKFFTGQVGVLLEEIVNPVNDKTGHEWTYFSRRFRKVVKKKQKVDISIFHKLLENLPTKIPEEVD